MIAAFTRAIDNFLGRGDAAVTVPPLDGALRPNRMLDDAKSRFALEGVDDLAMVGGKLLASAGSDIHAFDPKGRWKLHFVAGSPIACIAAIGSDGLAVGLASGDILVTGGPFDGKSFHADAQAKCLTAMVESAGSLYVANGSATSAAGDWQRDLMEQNASGSVWRIELESGNSACIADRLAWPAGLAVSEAGITISEAWGHRLLRLPSGGQAEILYHDLPGYPGRLSPAADGWWLSMFAPRSQLVEFVLRETAYRQRMLEEVPQPFWVSPNLKSGKSFYEPLQGGGVKHLGVLKPWAPAMSAGFCVRLDSGFQPVASLQSRADGATHGVTGVLEADGQVYVAARGDGVVVCLPAEIAGGEA